MSNSTCRCSNRSPGRAQRPVTTPWGATDGYTGYNGADAVGVGVLLQGGEHRGGVQVPSRTNRTRPPPRRTNRTRPPPSSPVQTCRASARCSGHTEAPDLLRGGPARCARSFRGSPQSAAARSRCTPLPPPHKSDAPLSILPYLTDLLLCYPIWPYLTPSCPILPREQVGYEVVAVDGRDTRAAPLDVVRACATRLPSLPLFLLRPLQ